MVRQLYPDPTPDSSEQTPFCPVTDSADFTAQIIHFLDRPIAFHRCFASITGSITAALMLSQALYWQRRCKNPEGWLYKTRDDWYEETGMGRREQEGARRKLRQLQVLQEKRCGVPAQLWYRVNEPRLLNLLMDSSKNDDLAPAGRRKTRHPVGAKPAVQLVQNRPSSWYKTAQLDGPKPPNKLAQNRPTPPFTTETTTEITSETTTTTTTTTLAQNEPALHDDSARSSSSCSQRELIFDFHLAGFSQQEKERATKLLEGLNTDTAQQVLDEFNEALGSKTIKKSRWAWLRQVAQTAREGTFQPTADLSERRRKQHQATATHLPARKPSQIWEHHREELLVGITPADYHTYIAPLHGQEDSKALWLEAPSRFVADWVLAHLSQIEQAMKAHTRLPIQVCIG